MNDMFDGLAGALNALMVFVVFSVFVLVPLSIWKLVEIAIWFFSHLEWS